ncbi:MAG: hypothetical protein Q9227_006990 [Pyrenula ochraceoflavens]
MAPNPGHTAYQALLGLEKSKTDPTTQLDEAAEILGVSFESLRKLVASQEPLVQVAQLRDELKDRWVLKWLLKRTTKAVNAETYRLDSKTWLIFAYFTKRLCPTALGQVLSEYNISNTLEKTLAPLLQESESVHETVAPQSAQVTAPRGSRKRKRDTTDDDPRRASISEKGSTAFQACDAILYGISECVGLAKQSDRSDRSAQCLKSSLRGNTETSARIAGYLLEYGRTRLVREIRQFGQDDVLFRTPCKLRSILYLWNFRKLEGPEGDVTPSNKAFSQYCSIPALAMLDMLKNESHSIRESHGLEIRLQQLLVQHTIFPARLACLNLNLTQKASETTPSIQALEAAASNLGSPFISQLQHSQNDDRKITTLTLSNFTSLLPILLDLAIRVSPSRAAKARQEELAWINTLFALICEISGSPIGRNEGHTAPAESVQCLEECLHVFRKRRTTLPLPLLVLITSRYSGLLSRLDSTVQWGLVSQLIQLDVNIFLPTSGIDETQALLDALLAALSDVKGFSSDPTLLATQYQVVVALMRGFADARDMGTLFETIREQIALPRHDIMRDEELVSIIWDDEYVIEALTTICDTSMTPTAAKNEILKARKCFAGETDFMKQYASVILLDTLLASNLRLFDGYSDQLMNLISSFAKALEGNSCPSHVKRAVYRCTWHIATIFCQQSQEILSDSWNTITSSALASVQSVLEDSIVEASDRFAEAFEAFRLLVMLGTAGLPQKIIARTLSLLNKSLLALSASNVLQSGTAWDGKSHSLKTLVQLNFACTATCLMYPEALSLIPQQALLLFQTLLQCAEARSENVGHTTLAEPSFRNIVVALVTDNRVTSNIVLVSQLVEAIMAKCTSQSLLYEIDSLLLGSLPQNILSRQQRARLCDFALDTVQRDTLDKTAFDRILGLLIRLIGGADGRAAILKTPRSFFDLTAKCPKIFKGSDPMANYTHVGKLCEVMWQRLFLTKGTTKFDTYVTDFTKTLSSLLEKATSNLSAKELVDLSEPTIVLVHHYIMLIHNRKDIFESLVPAEDAATLEETWLLLMVKDLQILRKSIDANMSKPQCYHLQCILSNIAELVQVCKFNSTSLSVALKKLNKTLSTLDSDSKMRYQIESKMNALQHRIMSQALQREPNGSKAHGHNNVLPKLFFQPPPNSLTKRALLNQLSEALDFTCAIDDKEDLMLLQGMKRQLEHDESPNNTTVLGIAPVAKTAKITDRDSEQNRVLRQILVSLQESLSKSPNLPSFSLKCDSILYLISSHPILINSFIFENTFKTIRQTASSHGPSFSAVEASYAASVIYPRLCQLAIHLISRHRKHLRSGRQLLLQALAALLACLFQAFRTPHTSTAHHNPLSSLPIWASSSSSSSASSFSRLLTTLADPSPSSVPHHSSSSSTLNDIVAQARRTEGCFLQGLIQVYCACRLHGYMEPEVKERLMPGMYAVMEAMGPEVMRACNAQMDSECRSVFKDLYGEWVKEGRWGGR